MMSKFPGSDHSCRRRYVAKLLAERRRIIIIRTRYTSARQYVMPCESGRRSRDQRPTVKQRFLDVSSNLGKFWKKSLNGHATVVGGHATVGRLSNNVFWTFQAIWENFEKSRWTVTRQWLRSRDRRPTVKQRFLDVSSDFLKILKNASRWTVTRQWSEVTRPSADCQTTFFGRFKQLGKILKKVAERSRDSGRRSRDRRTVKRRQATFFGRFKRFAIRFWKKSLNGHATVVGGHATVGRLSNNVFWTFQAIWENFEKSRWTVTRQWLRSRDRRPTVKQRFLDAERFSGRRSICQTTKRFKQFEKSRWTVTRQWSEVTRPSADCQTTFFGRFKQLENFEKSRWTVTRQWSEVTRPSADCQTTFFGRKKFQASICFLKSDFEKSRWTVTRQWSEVTRPSADRCFWPTVKQRFLDVSSN